MINSALYYLPTFSLTAWVSDYVKHSLLITGRRTCGSCAGPDGCPALVSGCLAPGPWRPRLAAHTLWHAGRSSDAAGPPAWSGTGEQKTEVTKFGLIFVFEVSYLASEMNCRDGIL